MGDDLQNHEKWANVWNLRKEDNTIDTWLIGPLINNMNGKKSNEIRISPPLTRKSIYGTIEKWGAISQRGLELITKIF